MKIFLVAMVAMVAIVARTGAQTQTELEDNYKTMDQNGNGFIEREEKLGFPEGKAGDWKWQATLNHTDYNKDGKLSISEVVAYTLMKNIDTNKDGIVEKEEMIALMGADKVTDTCWKAMVKKADKDGDGKIASLEFSKVDGNQPEACSGADKNSEDFMGTEELVAVRQTIEVTNDCWMAILKKADKEGNGNIIKTDLSEAVAIMKKVQKFGNMTESVAESIADPPEHCSGAESLTTALSVLTLLALALRLF